MVVSPSRKTYLLRRRLKFRSRSQRTTYDTHAFYALQTRKVPLRCQYRYGSKGQCSAQRTLVDAEHAFGGIDVLGHVAVVALVFLSGTETAPKE